MKRRVRGLKWYLLIGGFTLFCFGFYLWSLYRTLDKAFNSLSQFGPTKIYSDVSRVNPPQRRSDLEEKFKALGYQVEKVNEVKIQFVLNPIDYPPDLIGPEHITRELSRTGKKILLHFDSHDETGTLHSITVDDKEIPEIFLEPELITTLARPPLSLASRDDKKVRTSVTFENIPAMIWKAFIAIEDQYFLEHRGLDPRGIGRALWVNLRTMSFAQGGSTITQQLVKNLMVRRSKNIFKKINELFLALLLEGTHSKEAILERYLNEVYLGQVGNLEIHGIVEGARYFFGKELKELNLGEVSLMAGLIRGPGFYSPYRNWERAKLRQRIVLKKMVDTKQIAQEEANAASDTPLHLQPPQGVNRAPFFSDFVKAELIRFLGERRDMTEEEVVSAGFKVYTTLDTFQNSIAQKAVAVGVSHLESQMKLQEGESLEGALVSVEQVTGFIRALIGGKSYGRSTFNRILNMRRQVGSTFKPLVFAAAILARQNALGVPYGGGYPLEDSPWKLTYDRGKRNWSPKNYEKEYQGWISFRAALAKSINTATARLGIEVGLDKIIQLTRSLGITAELQMVPSVTLGVAELTPIELLRIYAAIANHGYQDELTVIRKIIDTEGSMVAAFEFRPRLVLDSGVADLMTDFLQTVFLEGTARNAHQLGFQLPAAGKTGTTSQFRDAWFAGFTPERTAVVWVGFDQTRRKENAKDLKLTGATSALPIWVRFMNEVAQGEAVNNFPTSPHLIDVPIDQFSGKKASPQCPIQQVIVEKYIKDFEPQEESCENQYPASVKEIKSE